MTGICGLIGRAEDDLESKAKRLLSLMRVRGPDSRTFSHASSEGKMIAIGICDSSGLHSFDRLSMPLVLDGVIFEDKNTRSAEPPGPSRLIQTPGAFAFLTLLGDQLVAGRDMIGQKPLYFSQSRETVAFASLKAPLASTGFGDSRRVPPGQVLQTSADGNVTIRDFSLKQLKEESIIEQDAIATLGELFAEAIRRILPRRSGIAFSGGLDSGLVAQLAKLEGLEPELISVGLEGQPELKHARQTAETLQLSVSTRELSTDEIIDSLPTVIDIIETADPVIVGISIPIYFACMRAHELGLRYLAAGQLSDEMFGGYGRFEEIALRAGTSDLSREMFDSVVAASANDFDPGDKLAVAAGLELCSPFAYLPLVEYALKIPAPLRVKIVDGRVIRKYILRKLAAHLDMPMSVAERPKKAVQYSSGVQRVLVKEAKRRGLSLGKMLESFTR